jgi:hypothetical protein
VGQKKIDEPLTYIPPVVKHSFLDVFAFDNGSQGASMSYVSSEGVLNLRIGRPTLTPSFSYRRS